MQKASLHVDNCIEALEKRSLELFKIGKVGSDDFCKTERQNLKNALEKQSEIGNFFRNMVTRSLSPQIVKSLIPTSTKRAREEDHNEALPIKK